ncbi:MULTISPECIES: hypothetical protein [Bifidobacterium]|uniref:Uncharacterized protein n=1 Tax=Bifidobacterium reuteri DSM 23975 TaxID=1437610 RepID=A0A087CRM4_9BIFI|nr:MULTISPECIES: hypothetical protein [Bifidobacterium]KFI85924.1 hypothetical protein BREU_3934 [Bifidobacterium reuteri DSM 23975]
MQAFKKYIPADYVGLTSLGVSVLLGVIGVAQAVYTLVNQAFSGKLSKSGI